MGEVAIEDNSDILGFIELSQFSHDIDDEDSHYTENTLDVI